MGKSKRPPHTTMFLGGKGAAKLKLVFWFKPGRSLVTGKPLARTKYLMYADRVSFGQPKESDFETFDRDYQPNDDSPPMCLSVDGRLTGFLLKDGNSGILADVDGRPRWCFHSFSIDSLESEIPLDERATCPECGFIGHGDADNWYGGRSICEKCMEAGADLGLEFRCGKCNRRWDAEHLHDQTGEHWVSGGKCPDCGVSVSPIPKEHQTCLRSR